MVSTIDDYFRLLEVLRTGGAPILQPATARLMAENAIGEIPVTYYPAPAAWGWTLGASYLKDARAANTPQRVGTWQWSGAYGHTYFVDPREKLTVICMTNTAIAGIGINIGQRAFAPELSRIATSLALETDLDFRNGAGCPALRLR